MSIVLETSSAAVEEDGTELVRVNQYTLQGKLGEGAYGVVLECEDDKHNKFAIKYVSKSLLKRQKEYTKVGRKMTVTTAFDDVKKEIAVMKKLSHPKLVQLIEVIDDPDNDKLFMVMELVNGGQVMEWNKDTKGFTSNPRLAKPGGTGHEMTEENAKLVVREVIKGLDYLHKSRVVHRDLKPQNLLLTGDRDQICVKIADFGVSHMFESLEQTGEGNEADKLTKVKGTYPFYAPECLEPTAFDGYKADIWALGINLYCFLSGKLPFYDDVPPTMFDMITNNPVDFGILINEFGCSNEVVALARRLLDKNPETRPGNARAVIDMNDPWLGEFSAAFTPIDLDLYTVASLKIFAQKWRRRAASNAMKRKEDELRKSMLSEHGSPAVSPKPSFERLGEVRAASDLPKVIDIPQGSPKPETSTSPVDVKPQLPANCTQMVPAVIDAPSTPVKTALRPVATPAGSPQKRPSKACVIS